MSAAIRSGPEPIARYPFGLSYPWLAHVGRELLVSLKDVLDEPLLKECHGLDGGGHFARREFFRVLTNLTLQFPMAALVFGEARIGLRFHQAFFECEVVPGVVQ